jgi:extracellular elastinolytic metalloproteinase
MKSALLFGLLGASLRANAHPAHKSDLQRRTVDLRSYTLKTTSQYINTPASKADPSLKLLRREGYVETATELVKKIAPDAEFRVVNDHYVGNNGIAHVNFRQTVHGIDIGNADFNVNVCIPGQDLSRA